MVNLSTSDCVFSPNMLDGYITDRKEFIEQKNKKYEIQYYQNEHSNEYVISEMENNKFNGKRQLFKDGILIQSWNEKNNIKDGIFKIYNEGKAICVGNWNSYFKNEDICYILDSESGVRLIIRDSQTNHVIYSGEFHNMEKEGYGYEYDRDSGNLLSYGIYKNNELFQLIQHFEENIMIEYAIEKDESNINLINRHPVYRGGYCLNEEKNCYERHGKGMEYDANSGLAILEGEWIHNTINKSTILHNGWYNEHYCEDSLKSLLSNTNLYTSSNEITSVVNKAQDLTTINKHTTTVYISANSCNDHLVYFNFNNFIHLNSLITYNNCFKYVDEVHLCNLNLEDIQIGSSCWSSCVLFEIKKCEKLKKIQIDDDSFSSCSTVCIEDCEQLESILLGKNVFMGHINNRNNLIMTNLPALNILQGNTNTFGNIVYSVLNNIPNLTTLILPNAFNYLQGLEYDNVSLLAKHNSIKRFVHITLQKQEERKKRECIVVKNINEWKNITSYVVELSITSIHVGDFNLYNLPCLQILTLGKNCFQESINTVIRNLPKLRQINLGEYALQGKQNESKSTLIMQNLPSLTCIVSQGYSFYSPFSVILEDIPSVKHVELPYSFKHVQFRQINSDTFTNGIYK